MNNSPVIFVTDFGHKDPYVGMMKAAVLEIAPQASIIDLTHAISPQDIRQAAFLLLCSHSFFPRDSIFVSVVDPGVGSERRILLMKAGSYSFIGPDNGLLSWVARESRPPRIRELANPRFYRRKAISSTFHGRDIMAPAAGHLLQGRRLTEFGPGTTEIIHFSDGPWAQRVANGIEGQIMYFDHYGNAVTNIRAPELPEKRDRVCIRIGRRRLRGIRRHYSDCGGKLGALINSMGLLEIAFPSGSAAEKAGLEKGRRVRVSCDEK